MNAPNKKLLAILQSAWRRKLANHPGYSLRALSRDLGVSPAFVSNMMKGNKPPPRDRLEKLSFCLELDILEREQLVKAVMLDDFSSRVLSGAEKAREKQHRTSSETSNKNILSSWVNIAVLEGLTLSPPFQELSSLQERLGITKAELERALNTLAESELILKVEGKWQKREEHLYIAGGRSKQEVRDFHRMMIAKADGELKAKTSQTDYERRLINGFTMALNPSQLEQLKAKVIRFLDELSQEAGQGECREIYQCNFQLFPLTKVTKKLVD